MFYGLLGTAAFILYILYDINSVKWKNCILNKCFFIGTGMLVIAAVGAVCSSLDEPRLFSQINFGMNTETVLLVFLGMVFVGLLVYTLFFALPFEKTYVNNINSRAVVYDKGVYALCRHPGVIWFIGVFVCLGLEFSAVRVIVSGALFCLLNIIYVVFQDNWTFPKIFGDYNRYKEGTPFLIPSCKSIKKCFNTMKG